MNFKIDILSRPALKQLIEFVAQDGMETYIIGGWVRDLIMGSESDDMDIVVVGDGIHFAQRFAKFLGLDKEHVVVFKRFGTAKIRKKELEFDFVGTRKETYTENSRNPIVEIGTINDDQLRRDFTINALAISLNPSDLGDLIDPFKGVEDIRKGVIKTPIDADKTFKDDPLRMLRAVRFASRFGFFIASWTMEAIQDNAKRISIISDERIMKEFSKILQSKNPRQGIVLLDHAGLLDIILPELTALKGVDVVDGKGHKDNFVHTLIVLEQTRALTDDLNLLWTALIHDIGKAKTKKFVKGEGWTFHLHEKVGARMAKQISPRMKWSSGGDINIDNVIKLIELHGKPKELVGELVSDSAIRRFVLEADEVLDELFLFCSCDITTRFEDKKLSQQKALIDLRKRIDVISENDQLRNFEIPVSGDWIMSEFNLKPCKAIGDFKERVKEAILEGDLDNSEDAAREFCRSIKEEIIQ